MSLKSVVTGLLLTLAFTSIANGSDYKSLDNCNPVIVFGPVSQQGRDLNRAPSVLVVFREMELVSLQEKRDLNVNKYRDLELDFKDTLKLFRSKVISKAEFLSQEFELEKARLESQVSEHQLNKTLVRLEYNQKASELSVDDDINEFREEYSKKYWRIYSKEFSSQLALLRLSKQYIEDRIGRLGVLKKKEFVTRSQMDRLQRRSRDLSIQIKSVQEKRNIVDRSGCSIHS